MHSTRTGGPRPGGERHIKQLLEGQSRVTNGASLKIIHKITIEIFDSYSDYVCVSKLFITIHAICKVFDGTPNCPVLC